MDDRVFLMELQVEGLKKQNDLLQDQNNSLLEKEQEMTTELEQLKSENVDLLERLESMVPKEDLETKVLECEELKAKLDEMQNMKTLSEMCTKEFDKIVKEKTNLVEEKKDMWWEMLELKLTNQLKDEALVALRDVLVQINKYDKEQEEKFQGLENQVDTLKEELCQKESERLSLDKELEEVKEELLIEQQEIVRKDNELQALREEVEDCEQIKKELLNEQCVIVRKDYKIEQLNEQVQRKEAEIAKKHEKIEMLKEQLFQRWKELNGKDEEIDNLKEQVLVE